VKAYAKLNLALVVGPVRPDGKHEVATVLQAIDLHDDVSLEPHRELTVEGFPEDTLVRDALGTLATAARIAPAWRARIEKRVPVAAGLGGGSSDAAASLVLANAGLREPLDDGSLHRIAATLGADVPFFLRGGTQLGTADGTELRPLELPLDYTALMVVATGARKASTGEVYGAFDERAGPLRFEERRRALLEALERVERAADLAKLPPNDLVSSPLADELERLGAFRADVTGAGPAVYGLFEHEEQAERAAAELRRRGTVWIARPLGAS
jgi:4-diphosphocytidyl-2-C-methyl-D-erythritol kinase